MNDKQGEQISALLDGELDPASSQRTVSELIDGRPEALASFGRYRLIGDVMRGESAVLADRVADRVREALRDEPVVLAPQRPSPRWLRPVAGIAMAASVAAAAVYLAPQLLTQGDAQLPGAQFAAQPAPIAETLTVALHNRPEPGWKAVDPQLEERLNRLVIEHNEFAGRTGIHGPVPHIGLVSYDAR